MISKHSVVFLTEALTIEEMREILYLVCAAARMRNLPTFPDAARRAVDVSADILEHVAARLEGKANE